MTKKEILYQIMPLINIIWIIYNSRCITQIMLLIYCQQVLIGMIFTNKKSRRHSPAASLQKLLPSTWQLQHLLPKDRT